MQFITIESYPFYAGYIVVNGENIQVTFKSNDEEVVELELLRAKSNLTKYINQCLKVPDNYIVIDDY